MTSLRTMPGPVVLCGALGPIIYLSVMLALGFFQPGYDHVADVMSKLGAMGASSASLMNLLGFGLLGVMVMLFSLGLYHSLDRQLLLGPLLIAASGACLVVISIFPCDPGCVNTSLTGLTHRYFGFSSGVLSVLAMLLLSWRFRGMRAWRSHSAFTFFMAALAIALWAGFFIFYSSSLVGVFEKLSMFVSLAWLEVTAIRILRMP